ncbi:CidA/LrgA family protein [Glaciecola sp. 33A]|jgi:holin-like protein|uniref:CidA/LrgA family protein n=1 Tax=Glaciecola sp. 33A TaxID=2057807 RepID=UPI000C334F08|nr:CidA/LrgA family protein [Glaciecola sp. 33A]PKI01487.1 CidA/LrgA family protein [Glaciecola sp. 33A]
MNRDWVRGIVGFTVLCCIYFISLFCFHYFLIPLPPALIGIFILLIFLLSQRKVPTAITQSARPLLAHMGLFLLPALISVLLYRDLFVQYYIALIIAVLLSTIVSLGITLWLSQRILSGVKTAEKETASITNEGKDNDE